MVESLVISNGSISVVFNRTNSDYLIDDDGIDWGEITSTFSTLSNLDGYGSELNAVETTGMRDVKIVGWVVGTEAQMAAKKSYLAQVLYPQKDLTISVTSKRDQSKTYTLTVYVSKSITFGNTVRTNNEKMCRFEVVFTAVYPFFERARSYTISSSGEGILNLGALKVGARISLVLNSAVSNPYIYLTKARESAAFGAYGSFGAGTRIFVNTEKAHRIISVNGVRDYSVYNPSMNWIYVPVSYSESDYITVEIPSGVTAEISFNEAYTSMEDL